MIAIPWRHHRIHHFRIIADEAAIGMVNQKTTAVRVIPVEGKGVGEMANFGGLMGYAPIIPVNQTSCCFRDPRRSHPRPNSQLQN